MSEPRSKVKPDYEAATARTRHIFKPDVDWAQHPDPMTDEDWQRLARSIVNAALPDGEYLIVPKETDDE